jgi:hypothetical protein
MPDTCVVIGCRQPVKIGVSGRPCLKCEHHAELHAAQNRLSYLKQKQKYQDMLEQSRAYPELVRTVNTLTEQLRACQADNDRLRQRLKAK